MRAGFPIARKGFRRNSRSQWQVHEKPRRSLTRASARA